MGLEVVVLSEGLWRRVGKALGFWVGDTRVKGLGLGFRVFWGRGHKGLRNQD